MNKKLLVLFLFATIFSGTFAQVRLGAFVGVHSANVIENNQLADWQTSMKPFYSAKSGIQIGIIGDIPLGQKGFYFQPGIDYSAKGRKFFKSYDTANMVQDSVYPVYQSNTLYLSYVEIPLNIAYKKFLSPSHQSTFFISAGPYFGFMYSSKMKVQSLSVQNNTNYSYNSETDDLPVGNAVNKYKTFDFGLNARAGFEFGKVFLNVYASRGISNFFTAPYTGTFHHQLIGASAGIWFGGTPAVVHKKLVKVKPTDTDQDGVPDNLDLCPTVPGLAKYNGCPVPDSDKDGVDDEHDSCKNVAGLAKYNGCPVPDTDGDGVDDEHDSCKTIAGLPKYNGCPIPDTDGDGINDEEDKCPTQPGVKENGGCPEIKKEIKEKVNYVAHNILFATASDKLTPDSYIGLNELVSILNSHPEIHLAIEGHTDNVGTAEHNLLLSKKRAEAVANYLISKGIAADRISSVGYGQEKPIADNGTEKGRSANRRVELKLSSQ